MHAQQGVKQLSRVSVCMHVYLNHTLSAMSCHEMLVKGSLFSLHTHALAVEAIGALAMHSTVHPLELEAAPHFINTINSGGKELTY